MSAYTIPPNRIEPLSEAELVLLDRFLAQCPSPGAMRMEKVDGFFAALIAGPVSVGPAEYWPEVFGCELRYLMHPAHTELDAILTLLTQHWNSMTETLERGGLLGPLLLEDRDGAVRGNDWAAGFLRGVQLHRGDWLALLDDDTNNAVLTPTFMLAHEQESRNTVHVSKERRAELLTDMTLGLSHIRSYFRPMRSPMGLNSPTLVRH